MGDDLMFEPWMKRNSECFVFVFKLFISGERARFYS